MSNHPHGDQQDDAWAPTFRARCTRWWRKWWTMLALWGTVAWLLWEILTRFGAWERMLRALR